MVHLVVPRVCSKCQLPKTWFYKDSRRVSGLQAQCRDCQVDASRKRYQRKSHIDKAQVIQRVKVSRDFRRYGLLDGQRDQLLQAQNHRCALCRSDSPGSTHGWHVDHDHQTNQVRGILCAKCNMGLGILGDSINSLEKAVLYLKQGASTVERILNEPV